MEIGLSLVFEGLRSSPNLQNWTFVPYIKVKVSKLYKTKINQINEEFYKQK